MRERVTITIRDDLLEQVDRLVDGLNVRSRSQAVESLLSKILSDVRLKKALILAGGKKREIVVDKKLKFLIKVKDKPLLQHVMDSIQQFNVNNFLIYSDNLSEKLIENFSGDNFPYNIDFILGDKPCGTIEPLLKAKNALKDTFLVAYGDTITSLNLNDMLKFHQENKALATIALTTVSNPKDYGVVMLQGNKVSEFIQKPKKEVHSYLVNAGYFLFEPQIFKFITRDMKNLEKDLFPKLAEKGLLYGYPYQGLYLNINTRSDIERARVLL